MRRQQHDRCGNPHCRAELHGKGHVDHKNPLKPRKSQPQGTNDRRNLWLLCGRCNVRKHNRPYKEWLAAEAQRRKRAA